MMKKDLEEIKERENQWEVEEAIRTFEAYKKIMDDKELHNKAVKELEKKSKEYNDLAKELK